MLVIAVQQHLENLSIDEPDIVTELVLLHGGAAGRVQRRRLAGAAGGRSMLLLMPHTDPTCPAMPLVMHLLLVVGLGVLQRRRLLLLLLRRLLAMEHVPICLLRVQRLLKCKCLLMGLGAVLQPSLW